MRVVQMVPTVVGEGLYVGVPCFLIRLGGCNLHCRWCDTPNARHGGREIPLSAIVDRALSSPQEWILLTGGEPLIHRSAFKLVSRLVEGGKKVLIETNGTRPIGRFLLENVSISMDVKTPSSGEAGKTVMDNLKLLRPTDAIKFVIAHRKDFDWAKNFVRTHPTSAPVFFQPVWGRLSARKLAVWIYEELPTVRLGFQLHKIIKLP